MILVVGAQQESTNASNAGAVYVFDIATGDLVHEIHNPYPEAEDRFGYRDLQVSGKYLLIDNYLDHDGGVADVGSAYLFDLTTGDLVQHIQDPSPDADDEFGVSVSLSGDNILIGAWGEGKDANAAGAAYLYKITDNDTLSYSDDTGGIHIDLSDNSTNYTILSHENFTDTLATGWTGATVDNSDAGFGAILGRIGPGSSGAPQSVSKTYTIGSQDAVTIEFDLLEIDTWDSEDVKIYIDDTEIFTLNSF